MPRARHIAPGARKYRHELHSRLALAAGAAALVAQAPAYAQRDVLSGLADKAREMLNIDRQPRGGSKDADRSNTVGGIGALLAMGACQLTTEAGNRASKAKVCLLAAAAAGVVTKALSKEIMRGVKENDREKILNGAAQAVDTGQPVLLDLPDSKAQFAIAPTGRKVDKPAEVSFAVDNKLMDPAVPPLRIFGQPYVILPPVPAPAPSGRRRKSVAAPAAAAGVPVYATPNEAAAHPQSLAWNETVHVIGQVVGQPWLLVSRWVSTGEATTPMAIGYVPEVRLQPAKTGAVSLPASPAPAPASIQVVKMTAMLQCEESDFTKVDAKKHETKDTSSVCRLPQGSNTMLG